MYAEERAQEAINARVTNWHTTNPELCSCAPSSVTPATDSSPQPEPKKPKRSRSTTRPPSTRIQIASFVVTVLFRVVMAALAIAIFFGFSPAPAPEFPSSPVTPAVEIVTTSTTIPTS